MRVPIAGLCLLILFFGCTNKPSRTTGGETARGPVAFRTPDGFLLDGALFGKGSNTVILTHAFESDQSAWRSFARELAGDDYRVLTFNFRGYGDSEGKKNISLIDRDVVGAIEFMKSKHGATTVTVIGASMGGTAALIATASAQVDRVATLSSPPRFKGLDALATTSKVTARKLFMACTRDGDAQESALSLFRASKDPTADVSLLTCDDHGTDLLGGQRGEEATTKLKAFIGAR